MRRNDREMPKEFAYEVSDKCEWAVISMIDKYNMPYCVPISIVRDSEFIYFHCSNAGTKSESLKLNNSICISCVGDTKRIPEKFTTEYESVIIKGIAFEVLDKTEKIHALKLLCLRHASTNMDI